jgi:hypothetical protein
VAGLPRSPLSLRASVRRARRLLFVLGVGYALHLPYLSLWKTRLEASPAQKADLFASNALHVIAVSQLFVLGLQWLAGRHWIVAAAVSALAVVAVGPVVWASGLSARLPLPIGAYLDQGVAPSIFPVFPYSAFVLAGTAAGAALGRQYPETRRRRALWGGLGLIALGALAALALAGRVGFWGVSPGYTLIRLGGLLLLLRVAVAGLAALRLLRISVRLLRLLWRRLCVGVVRVLARRWWVAHECLPPSVRQGTEWAEVLGGTTVPPPQRP